MLQKVTFHQNKVAAAHNATNAHSLVDLATGPLMITSLPCSPATLYLHFVKGYFSEHFLVQLVVTITFGNSGALQTPYLLLNPCLV